MGGTPPVQRRPCCTGKLFVPVGRRVVLLVVLVMTVVMVLLLTRIAVHLVVVGVPGGARGGRQDQLQPTRCGGACRWPRRGQVSSVPPGSVRALRRVGRRLPGLSLTTQWVTAVRHCLRISVGTSRSPLVTNRKLLGTSHLPLITSCHQSSPCSSPNSTSLRSHQSRITGCRGTQRRSRGCRRCYRRRSAASSPPRRAR